MILYRTKYFGILSNRVKNIGLEYLGKKDMNEISNIYHKFEDKYDTFNKDPRLWESLWKKRDNAIRREIKRKARKAEKFGEKWGEYKNNSSDRTIESFRKEKNDKFSFIDPKGEEVLRHDDRKFQREMLRWEGEQELNDVRHEINQQLFEEREKKLREIEASWKSPKAGIDIYIPNKPSKYNPFQEGRINNVDNFQKKVSDSMDKNSENMRKNTLKYTRTSGKVFNDIKTQLEKEIKSNPDAFKDINGNLLKIKVDKNLKEPSFDPRTNTIHTPPHPAIFSHESFHAAIHNLTGKENSLVKLGKSGLLGGRYENKYAVTYADPNSIHDLIRDIREEDLANRYAFSSVFMNKHSTPKDWENAHNLAKASNNSYRKYLLNDDYANGFGV